jgi:hypothetical protein
VEKKGKASGKTAFGKKASGGGGWMDILLGSDRARRRKKEFR